MYNHPVGSSISGWFLASPIISLYIIMVIPPWKKSWWILHWWLDTVLHSHSHIMSHNVSYHHQRERQTPPPAKREATTSTSRAPRAKPWSSWISCLRILGQVIIYVYTLNIHLWWILYVYIYDIGLSIIYTYRIHYFSLIYTYRIHYISPLYNIYIYIR